MLGCFFGRVLAFLNQSMDLLLILLGRLINLQSLFLLFSFFLACQLNLHFHVMFFSFLNFQDKANPLATVLSAAMLLRYGLGEENAAKRIETAVMETLNRRFRTGDIISTGMVSGLLEFATSLINLVATNELGFITL